MTKRNLLSLRTAILININIMFGTGVFINTVPLAKFAGFLGFLSYLIVAILLLPLIIAIAALIRRYPAGSFYTYAAQDITPIAGFISAWAYFTAKLASAALLVHVFTTLIQTVFPAFQAVSPFILDVVILLFFGWLNLFNMKTGSKLMYMFIVFKFTPILFAIITGLYLWNYWSAPPDTFLWSGIPVTLPLVLYAFTGFEASCSLSRSIDCSEINGPKAVLRSYIIVVLITVIYQLLFFAAFGKLLAIQENFSGAFPALLKTVFPLSPAIQRHLIVILHSALASSALGSSYGILFSNHWNLYTLAEHKHIFFHKIFTRLNVHNIPTAGIILEILFCIGYLLLTLGNQIPLQQISVLGCTIAYTFSVVGILIARRQGRTIGIKPLVIYCALGSCLLLIGACVRNFILNGIVSLVAFMLILAIGVIMFYCNKRKAS